MLVRLTRNLLVGLAALTAATSALAEGKITAICVYPPEINLTTKADLQRFVVVATREIVSHAQREPAAQQDECRLLPYAVRWSTRRTS